MSDGKGGVITLNRTLAGVFLVAGIALVFWIAQEIGANFERQALIEKEDFGSLRDTLDEDFSGDEIETENGAVVVYEYSDNQALDNLYYDQASDLTLVSAITGKQRKVAGDNRRVIWFQTVERGVPALNAETNQTASEQKSFAYAARLATRDMYLKGVSDLVVGNLETLEQKQIAQGVPYIDRIEVGPERDQIAILYWDSDTSARHIIVSAETLSVVKSTKVELPQLDAYQLDMEDVLLSEREDAVEAAQERRTKPRPQD